MTTTDNEPADNLPERVVVGANGAYWQDYGDHYSMCPVSEDNDPVEPVAVYVRERAAERAIGAEPCLLAKFPGDECRTFAEPPSEWCANCRQRAIGAEALDVERLARALASEWPFAYSPPEAWQPIVERALARLTRERNGQ